MGKDYGSWSLADLKSELKKRNAKVTGKKALLVKRLEDYDNLYGPIVNDPEYAFKIIVPQPEKLRDITSESAMPAFTKDDLEGFCVLTERDNINKSLDMYKESFLITCRSGYEASDYFISGICASEMRKNITYNVTIKCKDHLILEAQCECAAGAGPYGQCKHIVLVLHAMVDFHQTKTIRLKASSTSMLQTFHHPHQTYTGNPVQAEKLTLKFKQTKMQQIVKFDPRRNPENVQKYIEKFASLIANYCGGGGVDIPIAQILTPANKKALFSDHDYLKKTAEEDFFESMILKDDQIKELELITKKDVKVWKESRKMRLHSYIFGRICKQKSNKMNLARSLVKTTDLQTPAIKHGKKYEETAIKKFEKISGKTVIKCGIIVHPKYQFLGSTPDGLVGENEVLEVKCPYTAKNKVISGDSVPYLYLCENSGELKLNETHDYFYQIQGQMFCAQKTAANFFVYTLCDSCLIKIERDDIFINNMIKTLKSFYDTYYKEVLLNRFLYGKKH